jgi:hypothetical protein
MIELITVELVTTSLLGLSSPVAAIGNYFPFVAALALAAAAIRLAAEKLTEFSELLDGLGEHPYSS